MDAAPGPCEMVNAWGYIGGPQPITHAEIDGRVTAKDIGMSNMISQDKTCIGKTMANRPGLISEQREQLVGIKPLNEDEVLLAGAHIYCLDEAPKRVNDQGHITSVCYSPSLKSSIGFTLPICLIEPSSSSPFPSLILAA